MDPIHGIRINLTDDNIGRLKGELANPAQGQAAIEVCIILNDREIEMKFDDFVKLLPGAENYKVAKFDIKSSVVISKV